MLDVSGWDIRKALRLFRKSNPPLLEWLQCPIRYREKSRAGAELDRGPVVSELSQFIETELTRLEQGAPERVETAPTIEKLDELFRDVLRDVWG